MAEEEGKLDVEEAFKTPKQKEQEALMLRVDQCEQEVQAVLLKWRMRITVIEVRQDGHTISFELKAVPDPQKGNPLEVAFPENGGD